MLLLLFDDDDDDDDDGDETLIIIIIIELIVTTFLHRFIIFRSLSPLFIIVHRFIIIYIPFFRSSSSPD
jgi:hypothetical protein